MYTFLVGSSWTGLSGVYNILDHYEHEQKRAVEYISTMYVQSHERSGELHTLLTHTRAEGAQPGQTEQVRQRERAQ